MSAFDILLIIIIGCFSGLLGFIIGEEHGRIMAYEEQEEQDNEHTLWREEEI